MNYTCVCKKKQTQALLASRKGYTFPNTREKLEIVGVL